jgi:hypothetical protein
VFAGDRETVVICVLGLSRVAIDFAAVAVPLRVRIETSIGWLVLRLDLTRVLDAVACVASLDVSARTARVGAAGGGDYEHAGH